MAATLAQRIQDLIGFDYSDNSINTENQAIHTSYAEVIDNLPESVLLKYAVAPTDLTSGSLTMETEGKKILRVVRIEGSNDSGIHIHRVCEKVNIYEYLQITEDTNSIYLPTSHSPIYTEDPETGTTLLKIFPALTGSTGDTVNTAKVWYTSYLDDSNSTAFAQEVEGIPNEVEHAVVLKAALYILQTMISDAIQDDEDDEMLAMLNNQSQSLQAMYQIEMARLSGEKGEQRGE
jgi:hypothetical protein